MPITVKNFATLPHKEFLEMLFDMSYSEIGKLIDDIIIFEATIFEGTILANLYESRQNPLDFNNRYSVFEWLLIMTNINNTLDTFDPNHFMYNLKYNNDHNIERDIKSRFDEHIDLFKKFHEYNVPGNGFICDFFARLKTLKTLNPLLTTCIEELFAKISA